MEDHPHTYTHADPHIYGSPGVLSTHLNFGGKFPPPPFPSRLIFPISFLFPYIEVQPL